jgi:hypothetical protein
MNALCRLALAELGYFAEAPRLHDGKLCLSEMKDGRVRAVTGAPAPGVGRP